MIRANNNLHKGKERESTLDGKGQRGEAGGWKLPSGTPREMPPGALRPNRK